MSSPRRCHARCVGEASSWSLGCIELTFVGCGAAARPVGPRGTTAGCCAVLRLRDAGSHWHAGSSRRGAFRRREGRCRGYHDDLLFGSAFRDAHAGHLEQGRGTFVRGPGAAMTASASAQRWLRRRASGSERRIVGVTIESRRVERAHVGRIEWGAGPHALYKIGVS